MTAPHAFTPEELESLRSEMMSRWHDTINPKDSRHDTVMANAIAVLDAYVALSSAVANQIVDRIKRPDAPPAPIPMLLYCPDCDTRHVDVGEFATKPHRTHACQRCGFVWRPALVPTVGVHFLPGYKDPPR